MVFICVAIEILMIFDGNLGAKEGLNNLENNFQMALHQMLEVRNII